MKILKRNKKYLATIFLLIMMLGQIIVANFTGIIAYANILFPKEVTIEFDTNNRYPMSGHFADGRLFSTKNAPIFAVYEGNRQPVFCYEPDVEITNAITPGYKSNPLPDFIAKNPRAKYISVLWKYAGTDSDTQIVAQAMFWKETVGLTVTNITRPDGTPFNHQEIESKINKIVDDYIKKPSFAGQTVTVNLGESVTLTDTDNVGLERFDGRVQNTVNVDWSIKGNQLTITPKKESNENGVLRIAKTMDIGTPVAYKLEGQQSVLAGAIDDPNSLSINIKVIKTGEVKILKLDAGTGKPVANVEFEVVYNGKTQKVKTNEKGIAIAKEIPHGADIEVTEVFVPNPYILAKDNKQKGTIKAGHTTEFEFKNERATGKTTITKQDKTTESNEPLNPNYPMEGAKYGIFKKGGSLVQEFTLAEDLIATIDKLELGSYFWKETKAPTGYVLDPTEHDVDLTYEDQYTPVVIDDAVSNDDVIRMDIDGQKLIQNETNEIFKNDVELTLTNKRTEEKQVVTTATVDGKKGYFSFKDLPVDDYVLDETKGVDGYKDIDPIEINHKYDKETDSFTFTVIDQKSGNILNEETITQEELSMGKNPDLGTYVLKDKAELVEEPVVDISTQAHTGDGETQTFEWGNDVKYYDDVFITHKNIEEGTKRAYETIQVAVYTDKDGKETEKDVWSSGKVDYTVTDKEITERVLSEYDYKQDPEGTRYYFKELGYNKPSEDEYVKDAEHNFDGKEKTQDLTPIKKEEPPVKEEPPTIMDKLLPNTGEKQAIYTITIGTILVLMTFIINRKQLQQRLRTWRRQLKNKKNIE